jgi:hypothetical protein
MKIKIVINTFTDTRTREEAAQAFYVKGYNGMSQVWEGELDIKEDNVYLTKVSVIGEGIAHPICDIPFSLGVGHWLWVPPENPVEESEDAESILGGQILDNGGAVPPRFVDLGKSVYPAMRLQGRKRNPRTWLAFHHLWRSRS